MTQNVPPSHLTSLLRVEERLQEAEYFARRLSRHRDSTPFGYELNAFLSAARSVTFLLQKELSHVDGFAAWWQRERQVLSKDEAARFFLELRNFSQKQGPISLVSVQSSKSKRWTFMFTGTDDPVPRALFCRDVADCCREHLGKLAQVLLRCTEAFPYHCCPRSALTPPGVAALKLDLNAVDAALGYPTGWTDFGGEARRTERVRVLQSQIDGLDFGTIRRIARYKPRPAMESAPSDLGISIGLSMVERIEVRRDSERTRKCPQA